MLRNLFVLSFVTIILTSCGERSQKVEPLKRGDKNLSCADVQLEINEAEFYKKQAFDKKRLGIKSIVMPLGYIDTFMSADEAIEAAEARVQYLNRIYDIKRCDPTSTDISDSEIQANIQRVMQPQQMQVAPAQPMVYGYPAAGPVYAPQPQMYQHQGF